MLCNQWCQKEKAFLYWLIEHNVNWYSMEHGYPHDEGTSLPTWWGYITPHDALRVQCTTHMMGPGYITPHMMRVHHYFTWWGYITPHMGWAVQSLPTIDGGYITPHMMRVHHWPTWWGYITTWHVMRVCCLPSDTMETLWCHSHPWLMETCQVRWLQTVQVYCPPWEVCRGLNVRLPLDTVIPFPLVTTPVAFLHVTTGMSEVLPNSIALQVSVYICPAVEFPDVVMLTVCTETEKNKNRMSIQIYTYVILSTQDWSIPSHWSIDVLWVDRSNWNPTGVVTSIWIIHWTQS